MNRARCVICGPLRGDPVLFTTFLFKVAQVAKMVRDQVHWTGISTTLIINGDLLDRYSPYHNSNMKRFTFDKTLRDYRTIMSLIRDLRQQARKADGDVIVIAGDHELAQLQKKPEYLSFSVPNSSDLEQWHHFVDKEFRPFMQKYSSAVVAWDRFYVSHGSINAKWLQRHKVESIKDINNMWIKGLTGYKPRYMDFFAEADSPIVSHEMSEGPKLWAQNNASQVGSILGDNSALNYFIVSDKPVQQLPSYDISLEPWEQKEDRKSVKLNVFYSKGFVMKPQMFFLNNQAADTFLSLGNKGRQPLALQIEGTFSRSTKRLLDPRVTVIHLPATQVDAYFDVQSKYAL